MTEERNEDIIKLNSREAGTSRRTVTLSVVVFWQEPTAWCEREKRREQKKGSNQEMVSW